MTSPKGIPRVMVGTKIIRLGGIGQGNMEKRCSKCGEVKGIGEFYTKKGGCGYRSACKLCNKKYPSCSKESMGLRLINWRKNNPEKARLQCRRYYQKHREKMIERAKKYAIENPLKAKLWRLKESRKYRKNNRNDINKRANLAIHLLLDGYIKQILHDCGLPKTEELIELKREHILLKRNLKKLKEVNNEPNHTNIDAVESKNAKNFQGKLHPGTDFK